MVSKSPREEGKEAKIQKHILEQLGTRIFEALKTLPDLEVDHIERPEKPISMADEDHPKIEYIKPGSTSSLFENRVAISFRAKKLGIPKLVTFEALVTIDGICPEYLDPNIKDLERAIPVSMHIKITDKKLHFPNLLRDFTNNEYLRAAIREVLMKSDYIKELLQGYYEKCKIAMEPYSEIMQLKELDRIDKYEARGFRFFQRILYQGRFSALHSQSLNLLDAAKDEITHELGDFLIDRGCGDGAKARKIIMNSSNQIARQKEKFLQKKRALEIVSIAGETLWKIEGRVLEEDTENFFDRLLLRLLEKYGDKLILLGDFLINLEDRRLSWLEKNYIAKKIYAAMYRYRDGLLGRGDISPFPVQFYFGFDNKPHLLATYEKFNNQNAGTSDLRNRVRTTLCPGDIREFLEGEEMEYFGEFHDMHSGRYGNGEIIQSNYQGTFRMHKKPAERKKKTFMIMGNLMGNLPKDHEAKPGEMSQEFCLQMFADKMQLGDNILMECWKKPKNKKEKRRMESIYADEISRDFEFNQDELAGIDTSEIKHEVVYNDQLDRVEIRGTAMDDMEMLDDRGKKIQVETGRKRLRHISYRFDEEYARVLADSAGLHLKKTIKRRSSPNVHLYILEKGESAPAD